MQVVVLNVVYGEAARKMRLKTWCFASVMLTQNWAMRSANNSFHRTACGAR